MWPIVTDKSIYASITEMEEVRSVTIVSAAKMAESIEMPFRLWTRVGPRNNVLDGGPDPPTRIGILMGKRAGPF